VQNLTEVRSGAPTFIYDRFRLRFAAITGADYDLRECLPGDLDPHAVSSVFKAYLRERAFHHLNFILGEEPV
jgi:hypothetical protein